MQCLIFPMYTVISHALSPPPLRSEATISLSFLSPFRCDIDVNTVTKTIRKINQWHGTNQLFSRSLQQFDRIRKRNAFVDNYRKEPMFADNLDEFEDSR